MNTIEKNQLKEQLFDFSLFLKNLQGSIANNISEEIDLKNEINILSEKTNTISEILKNFIPNFKSYNNIIQENIEIDNKTQNLIKSENIVVLEKGI